MTVVGGRWHATPATPDHRWVIVLAGGDGTRLSALTRNERGEVVPKQYCSFRGQRSLLASAIERAAALAPRDQILIVVAQQHEALWRSELADFDRAQIVVQPGNRGTAAGVLLPLSVVLERDPEANVTLMPSDHFVADESRLAQTLQAGQRRAAIEHKHAYLVGIEPDHAEPDYGWILPKGRPTAVDCSDAAFSVASFVEKPERRAAAVLWTGGAVWNSFLMIAQGAALKALFEKRLPSLVTDFARCKPHESARQAERLYRDLPSRDFSRDVLEGSVPDLRVLIAPACGWTDLGTPERLLQCLREWSIDAGGSPKPPLRVPMRMTRSMPRTDLESIG
tara:strand:- start:28503 stop:29513 length:1011 start_codon:yes stop_codon:yes gene_type:complete